MHLLYEDVMDLWKEKVEPLTETEYLPLTMCCGRVLAENVTAQFDQPPFARSPLDGYALHSEDIQNASKEHPVVLQVIGEEMAGQQVDLFVPRGAALRIMTGAPIPAGCDCVIGQEDTNYGEKEVEIYLPLQKNENICPQGEDYKAGTILLHEGEEIEPASVAVIASVGLSHVMVYRKPRVMLLSTGDELLQPGEIRRPGTIYDSNLYYLLSKCQQWQVDIVYAGNSGDDPQQAANLIEKYAKESDLIISTGGVSVGKKDIMHDVYRILSINRLFWKVKIKPGMPTMGGIYQGVPVLSLSGNPFGVVVTAELFAKPLLSLLRRGRKLTTKKKKGIVMNTFLKSSGVRRWIRGYYENGKVTVTDLKSANGTLSSLCQSNCLIDIPEGHGPLQVGEEVDVVMFGGRE